MSDVARYLITTADERTWKFDRPVVFLGEWCRTYNRRDVWATMNAVVAPPYSRGKDARDRDHTLARSIEAELFPFLYEELNQIHGTNYSETFWRILLGHWLIRYVGVIVNRYQTLLQCFEMFDVESTSSLVSATYHLATPTSEGIIWASDDAVWNSMLYRRVLDFIPGADVPVDLVQVDERRGFQLPVRGNGVTARLRWRNRVIDTVESITNAFVRDNDAFIINSYLPRKTEAQVQLLLGQVPKVWRTPAIRFATDVDHATRAKLIHRASRQSVTGIRRCARELLFELLPVCFLEGFANLLIQTERFPWPARPRFIFTSNSFDSDDGFKFWAAAKVDHGTPYYTGQHGNNYGTHRYANPAAEEQAADKFLTWGWQDGLPQHTPAFAFKTAGAPQPSLDAKGGLLLVESCVGHRITPWDNYVDFVTYFDEQKRFVDALQRPTRNALTIRFHGTYRRLSWSEEARWHDFDPTITLDTGSVPIKKAMRRNRLLVHSYDSTGILEGLAWNIPTVAFWQDGFDHLRDSAIPWYQLLVDAEIVHLSPESAATHVNAIWNDVLGWWQSGKVQSARQKFSERYARTTPHPAQDLVRLLTAPAHAEARDL